MSDDSKSSDDNHTNKRKADDDPVTAEERRARNRKSAYQSRLRKRMLIEELQCKAALLTKELESLREENRNLMNKMEMVAAENTRLVLINQQNSFMTRQQQHIINNGQQGTSQQQQQQQQQQQHQQALGMAQLNGLGLGGAPAPGQAGWNGIAAQMNAAQFNSALGGGLGGAAMNGFHQQLAASMQMGHASNNVSLQGRMAASRAGEGEGTDEDNAASGGRRNHATQI